MSNTNIANGCMQLPGLVPVEQQHQVPRSHDSQAIPHHKHKFQNSGANSATNLHKTLNSTSGILKAKLMKNGKVSSNNTSTVSAKVNDYRKVRI